MNDDPGTAPRRRLCRRAFAVGMILVATTTARAHADTMDDALHVLLTNDDGHTAVGIRAVRTALEAAGHRVTVVAPRDQQSGSSMRVTLGAVTVQQHEPAAWSVDGTPADAVAYALGHVLANDPPDIVVSGANFGQNLGSNTNLSGTVGAAIMATQLGVPAVAVSVGIDLSERGAEPERFPSTLAAFPRAAAFTVDVLAALTGSRGVDGRLLPPHHVLNVNYPARPIAAIRGVRFTRVALTGGFDAVFGERGEDGRVPITLQHGPRADPDRPGGDTEAFADGFITLSLVDGRLDAGTDAPAALARRLGPRLDVAIPADTAAAASSAGR